MGQLKNSFLMKEPLIKALTSFNRAKREGETNTTEQHRTARLQG